VAHNECCDFFNALTLLAGGFCAGRVEVCCETHPVPPPRLVRNQLVALPSLCCVLAVPLQACQWRSTAAGVLAVVITESMGSSLLERAWCANEPRVVAFHSIHIDTCEILAADSRTRAVNEENGERGEGGV